jgi:integrase/recombinase XerD
MKRTSPSKKAKELAKYFRKEKPDYIYMKKVFQHLRSELGVPVTTKPKKLPYVPVDQDLKRFYDAAWNAKNNQDTLIIKLFLYTGIRVSELINIKLGDIHLESCQIRITGKGKKDRVVPFPKGFKELLAIHINIVEKNKATYLFESTWKNNYSDRGIRKIFEKYSDKANLSHSISPHKLRHYLLTWLKKQGIDDALIQPYSGHESRKSLEIYSKLSIKEAQSEYNKVIDRFPI